MRLNKTSGSGNGSSPVKPESGKSKAPIMIAAAVAIVLCAGGFLAWKRHEADNRPLPAPMTVSTVPGASGPVRRIHAPASAPATPAPVANGAPQASGFAAIQSQSSSQGLPALPVAAAPVLAAQPPVVSVQGSIERENRQNASTLAVLNHTLSVMQLQYKIQELESKIQSLQNGGSAAASLPPPPSSRPAAPNASAGSIAHSLTVPLVAPPAPQSDSLVLVSDGPGGRAAVVRIGSAQYTIKDGEWVGGMHVLSITDRSVTLAGNGRHETLVLGQ